MPAYIQTSRYQIKNGKFNSVLSNFNLWTIASINKYVL